MELLGGAKDELSTELKYKLSIELTKLPAKLMLSS